MMPRIAIHNWSELMIQMALQIHIFYCKEGIKFSLNFSKYTLNFKVLRFGILRNCQNITAKPNLSVIKYKGIYEARNGFISLEM